MSEEEKLVDEQAKLGQEIAAQELDDEALDMVSGGGSGNSCYGTRDCDQNFKNACYEGWFHPNGENMGGNNEDSCDNNYGCSHNHFCDENWH